MKKGTSMIFKEYVKRFNALEKIKQSRKSEKSIDRPFNNTPRTFLG